MTQVSTSCIHYISVSAIISYTSLGDWHLYVLTFVYWTFLFLLLWRHFMMHISYKAQGFRLWENRAQNIYVQYFGLQVNVFGIFNKSNRFVLKVSNYGGLITYRNIKGSITLWTALVYMVNTMDMYLNFCFIGYTN